MTENEQKSFEKIKNDILRLQNDYINMTNDSSEKDMLFYKIYMKCIEGCAICEECEWVADILYPEIAKRIVNYHS